MSNETHRNGRADVAALANGLMRAGTGDLPRTYEAAKSALAQCANLDECQQWVDKAAALASYARQADDDQLEKMAVRIRARAVRRCRELLKQFDAKGKRTGRAEPTVGSVGRLWRKEAAERAGISERQQVTAVRVANVPEPEFTRQVESDAPPTITALAQQGVKPSAPKAPEPEPVRAPIIDLKGRDPKEFNQALHYVGAIERYAREVEALNHNAVLPILTDQERGELRGLIARIDAVHDMIATRI